MSNMLHVPVWVFILCVAIAPGMGWKAGRR